MGQESKVTPDIEDRVTREVRLCCPFEGCDWVSDWFVMNQMPEDPSIYMWHPAIFGYGRHVYDNHNEGDDCYGATAE